MTTETSTLSASQLREKVLEVLFPFTETPNASGNEKIENDDDNSINHDHDDEEKAQKRSTTELKVNDDITTALEIKNGTSVSNDDNVANEKSNRYSAALQHFVEVDAADEAIQGDSCGICLESLELENYPNVAGQCSHSFHYTCIMDWMKRNHNNCPLCRKELFDLPTYNMIENITKMEYGIHNTEDSNHPETAPDATSINNRAEVNQRQAENDRQQQQTQFVCFCFILFVMFCVYMISGS